MDIEEKVRIHCDHCHTGLRIKPKRLGTSVECPRCHGSFIAQEEGEIEVDTFVPASRQQEIKFCHHCGKMIAKAASVCPKCGVDQAWVVTNHVRTESEQHDSRKLTASLLAIFLGVFGMHWFYLGNQKLGVIYLLCTIPGLLLVFPTLFIGVLAMVDGIRLMSMSTPEFNERYPLH